MSDNSSSSEFSLVFQTVRQQARLLADGEISSQELVTAHLNQIERVNPSVNAIVTLVSESALDQAKAADKLRISGVRVGPLHGMPVLIYDKLCPGSKSYFNFTEEFLNKKETFESAA